MSKSNFHTSWSSPPDSLALQPHQVDVWRVRLNPLIDSLDGLEATLSVEERQRASRFLRLIDKERFIASHFYLRDVLRRYLLCEPDQIRFSVSRYGKPALSNNQLEFNLSHSGDFALIAVSSSHKVGVDVESIRAGISSLVIARQFFSKAEFSDLEQLPLDQQEAAFFVCWTRKEAYIKAQGLGLSLPLDSFDVSLLPSEPALLRATRPESQEALRWTLHSLDVDSDYAAAVAVEGQNVEFRTWDWDAIS